MKFLEKFLPVQESDSLGESSEAVSMSLEDFQKKYVQDFAVQKVWKNKGGRARIDSLDPPRLFVNRLNMQVFLEDQEALWKKLHKEGYEPHVVSQTDASKNAVSLPVGEVAGRVEIAANDPEVTPIDENIEKEEIAEQSAQEEVNGKIVAPDKREQLSYQEIVEQTLKSLATLSAMNKEPLASVPGISKGENVEEKLREKKGSKRRGGGSDDGGDGTDNEEGEGETKSRKKSKIDRATRRSAKREGDIPMEVVAPAVEAVAAPGEVMPPFAGKKSVSEKPAEKVSDDDMTWRKELDDFLALGSREQENVEMFRLMIQEEYDSYQRSLSREAKKIGKTISRKACWKLWQQQNGNVIFEKAIVKHLAVVHHIDTETGERIAQALLREEEAKNQ